MFSANGSSLHDAEECPRPVKRKRYKTFRTRRSHASKLFLGNLPRVPAVVIAADLNNQWLLFVLDPQNTSAWSLKRLKLLSAIRRPKANFWLTYCPSGNRLIEGGDMLTLAHYHPTVLKWVSRHAKRWTTNLDRAAAGTVPTQYKLSTHEPGSDAQCLG